MTDHAAIAGEAVAVSCRSAPAQTARAHATLRQGVRFISGLAPWAEPPAHGRQAVVRARYVGNCLRELDRFLALLLDAACEAPRPRVLTLKPDTAERMGAYRHGGWDSRPAQDRLRALDRSRRCLLHEGGRVACPDVPGGWWLTAGWRATESPDLRRYAVGAHLRPNAGDLRDIAHFYGGLGDRVVEGSSWHR